MKKIVFFDVKPYDKKWFGKARVIIVDKNNTSNRFPGEDSVGLLLEGNINITPNE